MKNISESVSGFFYIPFSNGEICCKVLGNGPIKLLAFYGFGQTSKQFEPLSIAQPEYTIYILDLPFHGNTKISDPDDPMTPAQVWEVISQLKIQEELNNFSLIGYSVGVKLIFPVITKFAQDIEEITLIAPDGIKENFWYRLGTGSRAMRSVFLKLVNSQKALDSLIQKAAGLKLVDKKTSNFARRAIADSDRKMMLYQTWCYLRKLKLERDSFIKIMNKKAIPVTFVVGSEDRVIKPKPIKNLSSKIVHANLLELKCGHPELIKLYTQNLAGKTAD